MLTELFQKQYDFEHQRRSEVTAGTAAPVAATTVLSGALSVALLDFPYSESLASALFLFLAASTLLALGFAILYIFRSTWNYIYKRLAPAPALAAHLAALTDWHIQQGADAQTAKAAAEADLREYITEKLSEAADWNGQNNDRKGNFLHMGTTAIAIALALFVPTALLYAYSKATSPDRVHRVQLTASPSPSPEKTMATGNNSGTPTAAPAPTPSTPAAAPSISPSKPVGPPNSQFRTNTEIPSPQAESGSGKKTGQ